MGKDKNDIEDTESPSPFRVVKWGSTLALFVFLLFRVGRRRRFVFPSPSPPGRGARVSSSSSQQCVMRGSFARSCAGAIEAANNRTVASVLKRFEGISAEEAKALGEGTIKVSELKTVKAIHAKTMYAPEETVYERVSFPFGT